MVRIRGIRNILLVISLLLLIGGAILRMKQQPLAWYLIGAAFLLYVIARFFLKK